MRRPLSAWPGAERRTHRVRDYLYLLTLGFSRGRRVKGGRRKTTGKEVKRGRGDKNKKGSGSEG